LLTNTKEGIEIRRAYDCKLPKILAYGSELNQAWTSLIDNAIDAIAGKGVIEIATACNGKTIQVQIADSGSGIPPEIQPLHFRAILYDKTRWQRIGFGIRDGAARCRKSASRHSHV
jgi:signal transduction histidine kinase